MQTSLSPVASYSGSAISAAKQMFAKELFHDPNLRKFFRQLFLESTSRQARAVYSVKPTERGLKNIDDTHPYYVSVRETVFDHSISNISRTNVLATSTINPTDSFRSWPPKEKA